jgi:hypothetical protein
MEKSKEIQLLSEFIGKLGKDSYIGPWLEENFDSICSDIRNDLPVNAIMPREAAIKASAIETEAKLKSEQMIADARKTVQSIYEEAEKKIDSMKYTFAYQMKLKVEECAKDWFESAGNHTTRIRHHKSFV